MAKVYQAIGNKKRAGWHFWDQAKNSSPKAFIMTKKTKTKTEKDTL